MRFMLCLLIAQILLVKDTDPAAALYSPIDDTDESYLGASFVRETRVGPMECTRAKWIPSSLLGKALEIFEIFVTSEQTKLVLDRNVRLSWVSSQAYFCEDSRGGYWGFIPYLHR